MLTIFEELVSVAICSRSNLRSTGLNIRGESRKIILKEEQERDFGE